VARCRAGSAVGTTLATTNSFGMLTSGSGHTHVAEICHSTRTFLAVSRRTNVKTLAALTLVLFLAVGMATAQSSGNFSAAYFPAACAINGGGATPVTFTGGVCIDSSNTNNCKILDASIKTSSGNGVTLLITPSAVTGLFTDTKVSNTVTTSTAEIGIQVCVKVDNSAANVKGGDANGCAILDERLQQVSQNFLAGVAQVANCSTTAGAADNTCFLDFLEATLSAHSYSFFAQIPNGQHNVTAAWSILNANATPSNSATVGACVGPGNVTVTQTKVFNNSGAILQE
jgi:hypothetical protein